MATARRRLLYLTIFLGLGLCGCCLTLCSYFVKPSPRSRPVAHWEGGGIQAQLTCREEFVYPDRGLDGHWVSTMGVELPGMQDPSSWSFARGDAELGAAHDTWCDQHTGRLSGKILEDAVVVAAVASPGGDHEVFLVHPGERPYQISRFFPELQGDPPQLLDGLGSLDAILDRLLAHDDGIEDVPLGLLTRSRVEAHRPALIRQLATTCGKLAPNLAPVVQQLAAPLVDAMAAHPPDRDCATVAPLAALGDSTDPELFAYLRAVLARPAPLGCVARLEIGWLAVRHHLGAEAPAWFRGALALGRGAEAQVGHGPHPLLCAAAWEIALGGLIESDPQAAAAAALDDLRTQTYGVSYYGSDRRYPWWPSQAIDPTPVLDGRLGKFPDVGAGFDAQVLYAYASPATRQQALETTRDRTLPPRAQATLALLALSWGEDSRVDRSVFSEEEVALIAAHGAEDAGPPATRGP